MVQQEDGSVHPDPQMQHNDIVTRREVLEFVGTTTASLAASEIFGTETLQEFARVLNKPSILEKHHLSLLEEQIELLWKYRDDGILLPNELYATVDLTRQTIDPEHQTPRKNILQRLTEIQQLLQPYKETSYVKELNIFFVQ